MSFTCARLALVVLALGGCGQRQLALALHVDAGGCTVALPLDGSVLYQLTANGSSDDGGNGSFCGACLRVDRPLTGSDDLLAWLRQRAPSCGGVHPGTILGVRISAWSAPDCPATAAAMSFCIDGPTVLVPDGTSDGALDLPLSCRPQCSAQCVPTSCGAQVKDCGPISDGCNSLLECGTCKPPLKCGGGGVPNVCGR